MGRSKRVERILAEKEARIEFPVNDYSVICGEKEFRVQANSVEVGDFLTFKILWTKDDEDFEEDVACFRNWDNFIMLMGDVLSLPVKK